MTDMTASTRLIGRTRALLRANAIDVAKIKKRGATSSHHARWNALQTTANSPLSATLTRSEPPWAWAAARSSKVRESEGSNDERRA